MIRTTSTIFAQTLRRVVGQCCRSLKTPDITKAGSSEALAIGNRLLAADSQELESQSIGKSDLRQGMP